MRVLLEIEQLNETQGRVSLGSYVEEVLPNKCFLIQMPVHRGYHYPLPRDNEIQMHLFVNARMFSLAVRFIERVEREGMTFAKMRQTGEIKVGQRRRCYRLECTLPLTVERITDGQDEPPPPVECHMVNFSDGGVLFATQEAFTLHENINLTFDIGTVGTVEAEVLRIERTTVAPVKTADGNVPQPRPCNIAVQFLHKCQKQKDRFYRYIVTQQREIIRRKAEEANP
jgi:c-di-GMP-binding flagellar brake protein YcgR